MKLFRQKEMIEKAIVKSGGIEQLAKALGVTRATVYKWHSGLPMRVLSAAKLKGYLDAP